MVIWENGEASQQSQNTKEKQNLQKKQILCTHVKSAKNLITKKKEKEQENFKL